MYLNFMSIEIENDKHVYKLKNDMTTRGYLYIISGFILGIDG